MTLIFGKLIVVTFETFDMVNLRIRVQNSCACWCGANHGNHFSESHSHEFFCPKHLKRSQSQLKLVLRIMFILGRLLRRARIKIEKRYAVGGPGYYIAKSEFYRLAKLQSVSLK